MSRGRRYSGEGKLNIKKVVAVLIALALIVIVVISIAKLFGGNKVESKVVTTEYFAAYSEGKWGVIDSKGKEIVKPSYDEAIIVPNSKEAVFICTYDVNYNTNEYKTKAVNEKGEQLFTEYDGIRAIENYDVNNNLWYEDDVLIVTKNGKYGLIDFINNYPQELSGGMRQRIALIRTLATKPSILLLDEPFSALDYQTRVKVSNDIYRIIKDQNVSTLLVTHDISEAIAMADRVIVLSHRPAKLKEIIEIKTSNGKTPIEKRRSSEFSQYFDKIWGLLNE